MVQKIAQAIVRQAKEECAQDIYFVPKDDCYELYMRIGDERRFIQTYDSVSYTHLTLPTT